VPSGRPWYELEWVSDWFEQRGVLVAWGTHDQPGGYDPSRKTDESGSTGSPITGLTAETAGFNYTTGAEPVLYLYTWVAADNYLLAGRVLRNQRTADF
jgi:hypothetical protein